MRLAVISCAAYADAWWPLFQLLDKFWPAHPWPDLVTDECPILGNYRAVAYGKNQSWCSVLAQYAASINEPVLLFQEDFFPSMPFRDDLIDHGLLQMKKRHAAAVRLYPCPGGDEDYGDLFYARVRAGAPYRISCQAAIWRPDYLEMIARKFDTASRFEVEGSRLSNELPDEILAFKRDKTPWPLEYLCSGITRGKWTQGAKNLCNQHGIDVDWTRRESELA